MTWHLTTDPEGEPTLWHGDQAILRRHDLTVATWGVRTPGDRREYEALLDRIWDVLTRVLAPTDEQKQRIGQACGDPGSIVTRATWWDSGHLIQESISKWSARAVLAALAAAPDPDGGQDEEVSG